MTQQPELDPANHLCGDVVDHDVPRTAISRTYRLGRSRAMFHRAGCRHAGAAVLLVTLAGLLIGSTPGSAAAGPPSNGQASWNFHQARVTTSVQNAGHGGSGVVVAVVDTWVESSHRELRGRVLTGADCTSGTCRTTTSSSRDACGHGTHVAGTVAGKEWGIAPKSTILPVRVLTYDKSSGECTGSTADVAAGINWATTNGAQIINLSLAPEDADTQQNHGVVTLAVKHAVNQGVVVVFAAGNNDRPVGDNYGGQALIVAATGPKGGMASYSQHGRGVTVAAPGGDPRSNDCASDGSDCIVSAWKNDSYAALAGTSMAAPHVSGLAALLLGQNRSRTASTVVQRITGTAHALSGAGSGRIDAAAALGVNPSSSSTPKKATSPSQRATAASKPPAQSTVKPISPAPRPTSPPAAIVPNPNADPRASRSVGKEGDGGVGLLPLALAVACLAGLGTGLISVARTRLRRG
jgi:subtilisin family serine protease